MILKGQDLGPIISKTAGEAIQQQLLITR